MNLTDLNLNFSYGDDLRETAQSPDDVKEAIKRISLELNKPLSPTEKVKLLGQVGSYCRSLKLLDDAAQFLDQALEIIQHQQLSKSLEIVNRIRRAHVQHWQENFEVSNALFDSIIEDCKSSYEVNIYLDFALQHRGKNYFDQGQFKNALADFTQAYNIRVQKRDSSLIESTQLAIEITKKKLASQC